MKENLTYEQAATRLETICSTIERGDLDIDSLASLLQEAKELTAFCKDKLLKVEKDVEKILENQN